MERWLIDLRDRMEAEIDRQAFKSRLKQLEERPPTTIVAPASQLEDPLIPFSQVMDELHVSPNYLNDLRVSGHLIGQRIGKQRLYLRSEVEEFVRKRSVPLTKQMIDRDLRELRRMKDERRLHKKSGLRVR